MQIHTDTAIKVNWLNINVPSVLAIAGALITIIVYITDMKSGMEKLDEFRVLRSAQTDKNFASVFDQLRVLQNVPQDISALKQADTATNSRIDRLADTIIEALRKDINAVSVKVEVQSTKIDNLTDKVEEVQRAQRAALKPPASLLERSRFPPP